MAEVLGWVPAVDGLELLAGPVAAVVGGIADARVAPIDPELADTAAFCEHYGVGLDVSVNCVIVAGKRDGELRYAACMVPATGRADVNGVIRKHLDVRKVSFAPMAEATTLTGMEYGGITPVGLPSSWPVLVDRSVLDLPEIVIGSGLRRSKLLVPGKALAALPNATVLDLLRT